MTSKSIGYPSFSLLNCHLAAYFSVNQMVDVSISFPNVEANCDDSAGRMGGWNGRAKLNAHVLQEHNVFTRKHLLHN